MSTSTQFPAFLSIEYRDDSNGFPAFTRAADSAFTQVEARQKRFEASVASAQKALAGALARPLNEAGALDLNVKGLLETARNSEQAARAARELANATRLAATAAGDNSQAARLEVAAMQAVAKEHEQAAQRARSHAAAMEQVQTQLDRTASAATRLTINGQGMSVAMQSGAASAGQLRMASIGVGQQMQDIAVSLAGGQRAATVFAQQVPQLAFALSGLEGSTNKALSRIGSFATFLSGPWGAALSIGALALGALATGMGKVDEASKAAQKASEDFRAGLSDMDKFADSTTGRMLKLADATVRAALAMNQLRQAEAGNRVLGLQQKGLASALDYARNNKVLKPGQLIAGFDNKNDPDVSAALKAAGFRSGLGGYRGNLMVLEREIQKAAQRRPELRGLANEISLLAAESVEAAKGFKELAKNAEFLTGKRPIVPGFTAPTPPAVRNSPSGGAGAQSEAEIVDWAAKRAEALLKAEEAVSKGIDKNMAAELAKMEAVGSVADRIADDRARQRELEQDAAEQLLATYREMLGAVESMGGTIGKVASLANGLLTGQFSGLGKAGTLLNLTSATAGKDGWHQITGKLDEIFGGKGGDGTFAKKIGNVLGAAGIGMTASSLVLGGSGSKAGAAIGGALGNIAGKALGKVVSGTLGKALGPLGSIAGGLIGSALGGLFKKVKYGTVAIGANTAGNLSVIGSGGNSGAAIRASNKAGNAIVESVDSIAEQLGGTVDASRGSVSIGQYKGKWRVSTSGYTGKLKVKNGAVDFGKDGAEEAARFAMQDLIRDGVITGLRNGTQALLKNAADLEKGLAKALKFEGVFRDLRKFKDPVGAAIDDLNTEFKSLVKVFQEAGATAAETAQLEELYQIKRKSATEDAFNSLTSSLDDLYKNLTIGDSGYSIRTRLGNAKAAYDPLAARVAAGDATAYNDFAAAAQTLIELQREYSGSAPESFAVMDQVTALTKGELDRQKALYTSAAGAASPFDTKPIVDAQQQSTNAIVSALGAQSQSANDNAAYQARLLEEIRASFGQLANFRRNY